MSADFSDWIGREAVVEDRLSPGTVTALLATLNRPDVPGDAAPLGSHWLLAPPRAPTKDLDADGHVRRGGFLPPVPAARRMWAASEVAFLAPLPAGAECTRRSTVADIQKKESAHGPLWLVRVDHVVSAGALEVVRERQTIVYLDGRPSAAAEADPVPIEWDIRSAIRPDPVLLFRYSALTFNSHRIHYDLPYATGTEGYPGLVVHGPLIATLLLDLCSEAYGAPEIARFGFRARSAAFAGDELHLCARREGDRVILAALGPEGRLCTSATATLRSGMGGSDGR